MPQPSTNNRQRLIRLIHVAQGDLRMDDDSYRTALVTAANKSSTTDMTDGELERVLSHLKRCGFKVRSKRKPAKPAHARHSRAMAHAPVDTKIRALWLFLHQLGVVDNPSEAALAAYVKRITKVEDLQWLNGHQTERVIESLKKWAMRFLPGQVSALTQQLYAAIDSGELQLPPKTVADLHNLIIAAQRHETFNPMQNAWEALTNALTQRGKP